MEIQRTKELPTVRRSTRVRFEQSVATVSPSEQYHLHIYQNHINGKKCTCIYKTWHLDKIRNCRKPAFVSTAASLNTAKSA
jgi:hypothetical protein